MDYPGEEDFLEPDDYDLYEKQFEDEFEMMESNFEDKNKSMIFIFIFFIDRTNYKISAKNNGQSPVNDRPVLRLIVCILTSLIILYNS